MINYNYFTYLVAFINISAIMSVHRQGISRGALAGKRSQVVATSTVPAQERHHVALVDVDAIVVLTELKSCVAMTLVAADQVDATAVVANVWVAHALV